MVRIFVYESLSAGTHAAPHGPERELLAAGVAMRHAIVDDLSRLAGVAVTCAVAAAPGRGGTRDRHAANLASVAATAGEDAETFVGRLAAVHDLSWIVAPETGGELAAAGVPTPLDGAASHRGRWLVKPDDGAGCLSTRVHGHHAAAVDHLPGAAFTLEPFVEGEALSISMIVGADLATAVSFNRQRIEIDAAGRLSDLGVQAAALDAATDPRIARLEALAAATARALPGLGGFVGIDVVWNEERGAVVIEVNPRVTCAYVGLSGKLGRNLAADILHLKAIGATRGESRDGVRA